MGRHTRQYLMASLSSVLNVLKQHGIKDWTWASCVQRALGPLNFLNPKFGFGS